VSKALPGSEQFHSWQGHVELLRQPSFIYVRMNHVVLYSRVELLLQPSFDWGAISREHGEKHLNVIV
jgi:hypothetical protein